MVELCHGCGGCRGEQRPRRRDVSRPIGRIGRDYGDQGPRTPSTGHSGDLDPEEASDEFVEEVMGLCIGWLCHRLPQGSTWRSSRPRSPTSTTSETARRSGIDSPTCRLSVGEPTRAAVERPASSRAPAKALEVTLGIDADRPLPTFHAKTFRDWFHERGGARQRMPPAKSSFTQIPTPTTAIPTPGAAVRVLEAPASMSSSPTTSAIPVGRVFEGFLEKAEDAARENVNALAPQGRGRLGRGRHPGPPTRSCSRRLPRSALHRGRRDARERHLRRLRVRRYVPAGRRSPSTSARRPTSWSITATATRSRSRRTTTPSACSGWRATLRRRPARFGLLRDGWQFRLRVRTRLDERCHRLDPLRAGRRERRRPHRRSRFLPDTTRERARRPRAADADRSRGQALE